MHGATQGQASATAGARHSALAESMWAVGAQAPPPPGGSVILDSSHPKWRARLPGGQSDPRSSSMAQQYMRPPGRCHQAPGPRAQHAPGFGGGSVGTR
uniref:Uncharacterized protein n=1 Tax=Human herpesvirus 2 TaxID=10310 RepID=A0A481TY09_HHV2|nr:hypothetical protein [Human alphaherpesvirus 2]QBH80084.1 hypothetical protein [Human alphaherpesvirus 2]QBH83771.1 hypothetical protein [Human alphaherpesvirus 2]QBH84511.1 hypothetical protein [Human alphaherpesvirus 2]QBH85125.1 hypothetical protein [Human alphaherpesvirus 2]